MHKLRIPDSLWETMKQAPGIDWGLVVVRSIHNYLEDLAKQQRNIEYYQHFAQFHSDEPVVDHYASRRF